MSTACASATHPTGHAMIQVGAHGENAIVIVAGANHHIQPDDVARAIDARGPRRLAADAERDQRHRRRARRSEHARKSASRSTLHRSTDAKAAYRHRRESNCCC